MEPTSYNEEAKQINEPDKGERSTGTAISRTRTRLNMTHSEHIKLKTNIKL